jgi:GNAT superfamily N-acetyltransferase
MPRLAETAADIASCFDVMVQLRPHLTRDDFVATVIELQADGFLLAMHEVGQRVVAVTGFRVSTNLSFGRHLYVDDLVVDADARSQGHGAVMLNWLTEYAAEADCSHLHLNSGIQREGAHRFYLGKGMALSSFHFMKRLDH